MDLSDLTAADVLEPSALKRYEQGKKVIVENLVWLSANVTLLEQIVTFPADFYQAPLGLLNYLAATIHQYSMVIGYRVWGDDTGGVFTLKKLRDHVNEFVRAEFGKEVRSRCKQAAPSHEVRKIAERIGLNRNTIYAHIDGRRLEDAVKEWPISVEELKVFVTGMTTVYRALLFGEEQFFVPIQFETHGEGYFGGELGYVFQLLVRQSKWVAVWEEEGPEMWKRICADEIPPERLAEINRLRKNWREPPIG